MRYRIAAGRGVSGATHDLTGRAQAAFPTWCTWTQDAEVLEWLRDGVSFKMNYRPLRPYNAAVGADGALRRGCGNLPGALENKDWVTMALQELLVMGVVRDMGAVGHPDTVVPTIVAPLNTAVKSSGKLRLCHDGRPANEYVDHGHFTMETLQRMRYIWRKGARLLTYDLTAAYWTLRLRWDASMLCGFGIWNYNWNGRGS